MIFLCHLEVCLADHCLLMPAYMYENVQEFPLWVAAMGIATSNTEVEKGSMSAVHHLLTIYSWTWLVNPKAKGTKVPLQGTVASSCNHTTP